MGASPTEANSFLGDITAPSDCWISSSQKAKLASEVLGASLVVENKIQRGNKIVSI